MHKKGFTLPFILILSVVLIGSGTALVAHIMHSLDTVNALYNGEKAYMLAESGIDYALLEVRKNPLQQLNSYNYNNTTLSINTYNDDTSTDIYTLESNSCYRLPYRRDNNNGLEIDEIALDSGSITFNSIGINARIAIICDNYNEISNNIDIESEEVIHQNNQPILINTLTEDINDTDNCTLFIKNEGDNDMSFTLQELIAPAITITSMADIDGTKRSITTQFPRATETNCNLNTSENTVL